MSDDLPSPLTPAETKILKSALGLGLARRPLTFVTGLLTTLGIIGIGTVGYFLTTLGFNHMSFVSLVLLLCAAKASNMVHQRDGLIKKLHQHIMSIDCAEPSGDLHTKAPS